MTTSKPKSVSPSTKAVHAFVSTVPQATPSRLPDIKANGTSPFSTGPVGLDRFVLLHLLGEGGMGQVFAAYDPQLDRQVALKLIRAEGADEEQARILRQRLVREARAMARIKHPNVAVIYDVGMVEDEVFIAMELVDGESLRAWMLRRPHPWRVVVDRFILAGRGLAAAHRAGIVHRDFKPSNVLLDSDGGVRVIDFGLAIRAVVGEQRPGDSQQSSPTSTHDASGAWLTHPDEAVGTPPYMSPEQHAGESVTAQSDQWSFCVALFEALWGRRPFRARRVADLQQQILDGQIDVPHDDRRVPRWLRELVLRGLSVDPRLRYPNMDTLLAELSRDRVRRRRRVMLIVGLTVGAVGAGAGIRAAALNAQARERARMIATCEDTDPQLFGIWDEDRKATVKRAFTQTQLGSALHTYERVSSLLDDHVRRWSETYAAVCKAGRVHHSVSLEHTQARLRCLDRLRIRLNTHIDLLAHANAACVRRAVATVQSLTRPERCARDQDTNELVPLGEKGRQVRLLRTQLDLVQAQSTAGMYEEAILKAQDFTEQARALDFVPLVAEALLQQANAHEGAGHYEWALELYLEALDAAELSRHDLATFEIWNRTLTVMAYRHGRFEAARLLYPRLHAALLRVGVTSQREASAANTDGIIYLMAQDFAQAERRFRQALKLRAEALGPNHPTTLRVRLNLGATLKKQGRFDEALTEYKIVREAWTESLGPDHPGLGAVLLNIGTLRLRQGELGRARHNLEQAVELWERLWTDKHPNLINPLDGLAAIHLMEGRVEQAAELYEHCRQLARASLALNDSRWLSLRGGLAEVALQRGEVSHALALVTQAQAENQGSSDSRLIVLYGRILMALGRNDEARVQLERVINWADTHEGAISLYEVALARFTLGKLLDDEHRVERAAEELGRFPSPVPLQAEIDAWLQAHPRQPSP